MENKNGITSDFENELTVPSATDFMRAPLLPDSLPY